MSICPSIRVSDLSFWSVMFIVLFFSFITDSEARPGAEKNYSRFQQSHSSEGDDLKISSIGVLSFKRNRGGYVDLSYLESVAHGDVLAMDFGGSYVYDWGVSFFLGLGVTLGYNLDQRESKGAYYPEAGIVLDVTKSFGLSAGIRRYHYLYGEDDAVVMMGLVFR